MSSIEWFSVGIIIFALLAMFTSVGRFVFGVLALVGALVTGKYAAFLAGYALIMAFLLIGRAIPSTPTPLRRESLEEQLEKHRQQNEKIRYQREQWARWDSYNKGKR